MSARAGIAGSTGPTPGLTGRPLEVPTRASRVGDAAEASATATDSEAAV